MLMMPQSSNANDQTAIVTSNAKGWKWFSSFKVKSSNANADVVTGVEEVVIDESSNTNDTDYNANENEAGYNETDAGSNANGSDYNANSAGSNRLVTFWHGVVTVFEWIVTFRWIVVIARWLIATGGNVAESAFLVSTVWVTIEIMAPMLVKWLVPDATASLANQLAVIAFTVLPEVIIWTALATSYEHWKLAVSAKRLDETLWAIAYSLPTAAFLVMTLVTLTSFVSLESLGKGAPQATGWWLVIRCIAGWFYGTVSILYSKGGGKLITTILENQSANIKKLDTKVKEYASKVLALQNDKLELTKLLASNQKELVAARLQLASGKVLTSAQKQEAITTIETVTNAELVIANSSDYNANGSNDYNSVTSNANSAGSNANSAGSNDYNSVTSNANSAGSNANSAGSNSSNDYNSVTSNANSAGSNAKRVVTKSSNYNAPSTDAVSTNPVLTKKTSNGSNANSPIFAKLKAAVKTNIDVGTGKDFKTIAEEAGIAYSTANFHKKRIYAELQQENANA